MIDRIGAAVSYLFIVIVAITAYEVVMRYVLNAPTIWVHELAVALAATCFVIGGPFVHQHQQHITISFVYDRLSARAQRWARMISSLLTLVFCVFLSYAAYQQAALALASGETSGTALNWPIPAYLKTLFLIAAIVMTLQSLVHLSRDIRRIRARG
ncbi:MAG TPA: TRAP transporter small permease subunit [Burkholderiales bacterium]|nr:TRAP transporter small permease subunit [Burkholderiales bacterium]